jgi:hypothetical protein
MLTEHLARDAAPKSRPYKLATFAGLYLLVTHTNALRDYLLSQPDASKRDVLQPDTMRFDHAAQ